MKISTPSENILKTLKGKKVLFLENDNSLDNGLDCFEQRLTRSMYCWRYCIHINLVDKLL
jgi:hypothetical protein